MRSFEERALEGELSRLPLYKRAAFAAAAATRQMASCEWYPSTASNSQVQFAKTTLERIGQTTINQQRDREDLQSALDRVMLLIPEEGEGWTIWTALADDALSALAYTLRTLLEIDTRDAVWAARRGYEAADQIAIRMLEVQVGTPSTEIAIKAHPIVQRELARQNRDLVALSQQSNADDSIAYVNKNASEESLITREELETLIRLEASRL